MKGRRAAAKWLVCDGTTGGSLPESVPGCGLTSASLASTAVGEPWGGFTQTELEDRMGGKLRASRRRDSGSGQALLISVVAVFGLALALAAGPAVAKKITGSKRSERIVGTKKSDRIKGKGGNDLIKGKGGNDRLNGGRGSDKVVGGKGNDKVVGGADGDTVIGGPRVDRMKGKGGNDLLNAADGRRDS